MTSVSSYVDRGGEGSLIERTSLRPYLVVFSPFAGVSNVCEAKKISLLVQNEERMHKMCSFDQRPLPPSVDTDVIHMMKWTRPSSLFFHTASDQKLDSGKAWERGYI